MKKFLLLALFATAPVAAADPGVQLCTISSTGAVKCEKIRPLQG